jgi:hypothetical protein
MSRTDQEWLSLSGNGENYMRVDGLPRNVSENDLELLWLAFLDFSAVVSRLLQPLSNGNVQIDAGVPMEVAVAMLDMLKNRFA